MKAMTNLLYRTMSARTSRLNDAESKPFDAVQLLFCFAMLGIIPGALLFRYAPAYAQAVWLTQGLAVSDELRTLWDVYRTAACPAMLLEAGVLLSACAAFGQLPAMLLLLSRGLAFGIAAAECFAAYPMRDAIVIVGALILPYAYLSTLLLAYTVRDAMRISNRLTRCLLFGSAEAEICGKRHQLMTNMLTCLLLTLLAAGLHTGLIWLLNDGLLG